MLESISNFLIKLFDDFSWKRFSAAVLALILFAGLVLVYEKYTSNFELNKIQKSAEILSNLQKLDMDKPTTTIEIKEIRTQLVHDLARLVSQRPVTIDVSQVLLKGFASEPLKNFLAGAAPWLLFFLISLPRSFRRSIPNTTPVTTFGAMALVCGWTATFLNLNLSVLSTFLTFLITPLIFAGIVGILAAIAIPQFAAYRMKAFNDSAFAALKKAVALIETYFSVYGFYPPTSNEAGVLPEQSQISLKYVIFKEGTFFLSSSHEKGDKECFIISGNNQIYWKASNSRCRRNGFNNKAISVPAS